MKPKSEPVGASLSAHSAEMLLELQHEAEELDNWLRDESISDDTKEAMLIREDKILKLIRRALGGAAQEEAPQEVNALQEAAKWAFEHVKTPVVLGTLADDFWAEYKKAERAIYAKSGVVAEEEAGAPEPQEPKANSGKQGNS
jgi:hypothetical protein